LDTEQSRDGLSRLILEETAGLDELAAQLEREHAQLGAPDVQSLNEALAARKQCLLRIARAGEERRALLRSLNLPADVAGLERLIRSCDPAGELRALWNACTVAAARCRGLNDRNGALVSARLQHVQTRLAALLNGRRDPVTYGRRGSYTLSNVGRVLATEA